ncbi:MAG: HNH endonuclease signature motif containing protein [Actinomycetota bacterium]|nr:HNH endonuclease signature motif containing protein [Actinomycetota bacterium]
MAVGDLLFVVERLAAILGGLRADDLSPSEAASAVSLFVRGENLCGAGKALCAERAARSGEHHRAGHREPATWLQELSGGSKGAALDALGTASSLQLLPGLSDALRSGDICATRASVVAEAASMDRSAEPQLLELARSGSLSELKNAAESVKAAARSVDDDNGRYEAIYRSRHLRTFITRDGAFNGRLRLTPDAGAKLLAVLQPASDFFFEDAREQGTREHHEAYLADALVAVVTGEWPGSPIGDAAPQVAPSTGGPDPRGPDPRGPDPRGPDCGPDGADAGSANRYEGVGEPAPPTPRPAPRPAWNRRRTAPERPPATVICRVDLAALRRGSLVTGETCEIPGVGPVPLGVARELFGDSILKVVISDGVDPRTIVHCGRTIPSHLRTALQFRDRCCVVPGCGRTFGLEYDHIVEFAKGGPTTMENLCRLCRPHHALKTRKGYRIKGGPGSWQWLAPGVEERDTPRAGGSPGAGSRDSVPVQVRLVGPLDRHAEIGGLLR